MAFMFIHHQLTGSRRFEVLTAAVLNIQVFWEVMGLVSDPQQSEGSECLHLYWTAWPRRI